MASTNPTIQLLIDSDCPRGRAVILGVLQAVEAASATRTGGGSANGAAAAWSFHAGASPNGGLVDGCRAAIAAVHDRRARALVARASRVPVVFVDYAARPRPLPRSAACVSIDRAKMVRAAVRKLADCGLSRVVSVGGSWQSAAGPTFAQLLRDAAHDCGIDARPMRRTSDPRLIAAGLAAHRSEADGPIGIVAADDRRGRLAIDACRLAGLEIPSAAAVVGLGNDEVLCETGPMPLASVDPDLGGVGRAAAELLRSLLESSRSAAGRRGGPHLLVPPAGVVARSSIPHCVVRDPLVLEAVDMIAARLREDLSIAKLCRLLNVSRSTIDQRFQRALGRSVHDEMVRVRLDEARRLIRSSSLPMKQVAREAGFGSVHYMTRLFRRECGVTPAWYRMQARQGPRGDGKFRGSAGDAVAAGGPA